MTGRRIPKPNHSSQRSASAAPAEKREEEPDTTQPIPSIVNVSSTAARSWKSHRMTRSLSETVEPSTSQTNSPEESPRESRTRAPRKRHVSVDQSTPQSCSSESTRGPVLRPLNLSDPINGPDPHTFGPIQYNPLSYSEGYASHYYGPPSPYDYYPAYPYPTYSAYPFTPTATSENTSVATVRPGSYSQNYLWGYPTEGGYMPESSFPVYDGSNGHSYHLSPYGPFMPQYPSYQHPYSATESEGHVEDTPVQVEETQSNVLQGAADANKGKKRTVTSRKSKSSSKEKTDEEKRRDLKEAVLIKIDDDSRVEPSNQQSSSGSDETPTPIEYSRKSKPTSRQRTEEEKERELRDAIRRRQDDYDAFSTWVKEKDTVADKNRRHGRREGFEAFLDVVLEKSKLSGKRAVTYGSPGGPVKETQEHETSDISSPYKTPVKRTPDARGPIVDRPTAESTKPVDISQKPRSLTRATGKILKPPPGLPYPPPNALLPDPSPSEISARAIQSRLEEADKWFHADDRKTQPLYQKVEEIARDYASSKNSEQDRIAARETTLLIGNVIANLHSYHEGRYDAMGVYDYFAIFKNVSSRYRDNISTGRRTYFEIDPLINRRAIQPRRSEKPEKKLVLIRHRRPEL